jgi:hypothetical protein
MKENIIIKKEKEINNETEKLKIWFLRQKN